MNGLPIRWRLSLWYMSLTALVLVIFSFAVYTGLERRLSGNLDQDLRSKASLAASSITFGQGNAILDSVSRKELSEEVLLRVIDLDGELVYNSPDSPIADLPPSAEDIERASRGVITFETVRTDDYSIRMITVPVRAVNINSREQEVVGALQMAYSTARVTDALDLLIQALLIIAPVAIVVAAVSGYYLAGRALQPVSDITRLASQIDADDLGTRLNLSLPDDELGRLASTFDSMLERIDHGFQRQRQFTGDAAHELRTPLALMRSQIDLALTQADEPEEFRDALTALDGDVGRMTSLVGTLLSLARADAGQLRPNYELTDMAELIQDVAEQLEPIASENELTISTETNPITAAVDPDMIIQVLVNLIDNAIKNTPAGGDIKVTVSGSTTPATPDGRGQSVVIEVQDTGIGIPAEHLTRIFDRFYRVDSGRARARGGTGLGLAICQAIANAHNGTITATSLEGAGTTFRLTLPANTPTAGAPPGPT